MSHFFEILKVSYFFKLIICYKNSQVYFFFTCGFLPYHLGNTYVPYIDFESTCIRHEKEFSNTEIKSKRNILHQRKIWYLILFDKAKSSKHNRTININNITIDEMATNLVIYLVQSQTWKIMIIKSRYQLLQFWTS